ncbi:MAG: hypothetical protein V4618_08190 [Pseudomonadota bacterium]
MQHDSIGPSGRVRPRAYVVDHSLVREMMQRCVSQTPSSLSDQFGISWNTWSKLRKGQPIRCSVALRLVSRVLADDGRAADPLHFLSDESVSS